jgi:hypothetical protein
MRQRDILAEFLPMDIVYIIEEMKMDVDYKLVLTYKMWMLKDIKDNYFDDNSLLDQMRHWKKHRPKNTKFNRIKKYL